MEKAGVGAAPYDLVAIVASAGGVRAMETILASLPRDFPVPIALVLHRGGTDGVQAIHQAGGIVLAQDRLTSQAFAMPSSAIGTGAVDRVLPIGEIGPALVELATSAVPQ